MFIISIALIAVGYALVYHAASLAKGYRMGHAANVGGDLGGVPMSVLLGIYRKGGRNANYPKEAMSPFKVTNAGFTPITTPTTPVTPPGNGGLTPV